MTHSATIKPVGKTALCCSYLRMLDAQSTCPIGSDTLARRFLTEETEDEFGHFAREKHSLNNLAARHALIDRQVTAILAEIPSANIISIGSGLETRAFRIKGGKWFEIDDPGIIDYKNRMLPGAECENPLQRIPCDFSHGALERALDQIPGSSTNVFIIEGVFYYLTDEELEQTLKLISNHSPYHRLLCDHITRQFASTFSKRFNAKIRALGADLKHASDVELSRYGYQSLQRLSVPLFAASQKRNWLQKMVVRFFLPSLRDGYTVQQYSILGTNN